MIKWAAAERSYPASEVSGGREETPQIRGQERRPGGDTLRSEFRGGQEKPPRARGQGQWPGGAT